MCIIMCRITTRRVTYAGLHSIPYKDVAGINEQIPVLY